MKMNERCKGRIVREHSSVLSFRGVSESFLLRCSSFVIKFNPRLSQLQPIDSLYLSPSVSLRFFSLSVFSLSSSPSSAALLCQWNFISGVAMKCDLWRGVKVQKTVVCACMRACLWLQTASVRSCVRVFTFTCLCVFVLINAEQGYLYNVQFIVFFQPICSP